MELTIEQALQQGVAAHKAGKLEEAERLYRAILQSQPIHPDANHNLGVIAVSFNNTDVALPLFETALGVNPKIEQFWVSYIDALVKANQLKGAEQAIKKAKRNGFNAKKLKALLSQSKGRANTKVPSQAQLSSLLEYYQNGRFSDAENLAKSLTEIFPKHQFGWKVLGTVLKQTGRVREALVANQKAVQLVPRDADAHYNVGNTLKELGRLGKAEASFRQAIALKPDFAEAHYNLGTTILELARLDEAEASYSQAIALKPDYAEAHNNLGKTLKELGRLGEAEASYSQAIALKPDYAEAYNNLGNTSKELGRFDEAKGSYTQAIALKPDFAEAHNNLGNTFKELGRLDEAEASYTQAIALKPDFAEVHYNLAAQLQELGRLDEAEASYTQAIALQPDYAEAHNNFGATLQELGRLEEAEARYTHAIALKPDYAEAHRHLTTMKKFNAQDEQYSKMHELYLDKNISQEQRCHINFGLAKACEDLGNFEQAYTHYGEGNVLRKKLLNYDINQDIELFRLIKFNYPRIEQNSLASEKFPKDLTPIFIVGMPRSGTTLVEQIISSHSKVTGAGELGFVAQFGAVIATFFTGENEKALLDFRAKYLKKLKNVSNGNSIVTDKMPHNFRYIGLLAAAFPEAKIIHVKRNPAAVCWANYKQYFESKNIDYCYAIDDVISYHKLYENLMDFWENTLSNRIYKLDYELLTVNQESETRQLILHLGLDWDEKFLSPQNNTRSVATASNVQIRRKVYRGSSDQWKKYEPFLNGALDGLLSP